MGEGRMIRVYFFCSCIPRPSLFLSALSSLGHHIYLVTMNFKINPVFKNYNLFLQISLHMLLFGAFLLAHPVKNPLAMQETLVWFLGREVYLEKRQAPHSSIPGLPWGLRQWRIRLQCRRPGFDPWAEKIRWRRAWRPTPALLPGEAHGQRRPEGCGPRGRLYAQSDVPERLRTSARVMPCAVYEHGIMFLSCKTRAASKCFL